MMDGARGRGRCAVLKFVSGTLIIIGHYYIATCK